MRSRNAAEGEVGRTPDDVTVFASFVLFSIIKQMPFSALGTEIVE